MRVLHFSDVHVQEAFTSMPMSELMGKRLLAAGNLLLRRGRLFREVREKLQALERFLTRERVDFVICTGDYTAVGSEAEYAQARAAMEPFIRAPLGFCTVPGNHDLYLPDTLVHSRFERHFGEHTRSDWPESAVDGAYPYVRLVGDNLAVIGLNSARPNPNPFSSAGRIPEPQLSALEKLLDDVRLEGRWVFVATHYGIVRRDGAPDTVQHGLENAEALLRIIARPHVVMLHGHIHHAFCHAPSAGRPWLFCAGSLTQRDREGLWTFEFDENGLRAIPGRLTGGEYTLCADEAVTLGSCPETGSEGVAQSRAC